MTEVQEIAADTMEHPPRTKEEKAQLIAQNPLFIDRLLNDRSLYRFLKYFWDVISNDQFKGNWHIEELCQELEMIAYGVAENQPREYDLIINVPPGTSKTTVVSIMFPAWCWTQWPWMRFICSSYSGSLSLESAEYCRDLIRSDKFQQIYPEIGIKSDKDTKSNFKIIKRDRDEDGGLRLISGGNRYSTSVGGALTGYHGHILIVDDPLDPNRAASEQELGNANRWVDQTLPTRKTDKAVTPTILIMQRLHQNDVSGHILSKEKKNIKHICLPGEIRNYRDKVKPKEWIAKYKDDLLDPVRMPWEVLKDMEADLGQYNFAGQVGQNPTPPGGGMFKVDNFIIIDRLPSEVNFQQTVRYWDKAATKGGGAFTVGAKMSQLVNDKWIVHDVKRGQWSTEDREDIIRATAEADGKNVTVYVEQEPGSAGKDAVLATQKNLAGYVCYGDRPTGDKTNRADTLSVQVNNSRVQLLHGDWNSEYIDEFRYFPFSTYKDQVDASSGAFNILTGEKLVRIIGRR